MPEMREEDQVFVSYYTSQYHRGTEEIRLGKDVFRATSSVTSGQA